MKEKVFIGFDIGATNIRALRVRKTRAEKFIEIKTPGTKKEFSRVLQQCIAQLIQNGESAAVGIGIAGVIRGTVLALSPNQPALSGLDLRKVVPQQFSLLVDNDARAFAMGEFKKGAGKNAKNLVTITLGTGIGRALIRKGRLERLKRFEFPEAWERAYQHARTRAKDATLAALIASNLDLLVRRLDPDRVVIGGGVAFDGESRFWEILRKELQEKIPEISLRRAKLRDWAGAWGMIFELKSRRG